MTFSFCLAAPLTAHYGVNAAYALACGTFSAGDAPRLAAAAA